MQRIFAFLLVVVLLAVTFPAFAEEKTNVEEIILVFKTHFDIGYTRLASEVLENYRTKMIDNALNVVDASKDQLEERKFVWTIPGWPLAKILENQTPERADRLDKAIREGRFVVHALPFTTHTETLVEEDLVHGLRFASNISRQYGLDLPTDAKMTDVPCHVWFLPTLLAHSGVTFMHEGTNRGSSDPEVPLLYFREGPDGSRVLTMHVDGYGSGIDPPNDWPYKTWLGLIHTGDNHGPPRPEEVDALFQQCTEKYPNAKVRIGRLADFGNAILEKEDVTKIPVVRGDMPDTWIHGPMCDPQGQAIARVLHERLSYLEILNTLVSIQKKRPLSKEFAQKIAEAREQSLRYGEHTWGATLEWFYNRDTGERLVFGDDWQKLWDSQNWTLSQERMIQSWEEKTDCMRIAANMASLITMCLSDQGDHELCFNPLPWDVRGLAGTQFPAGGVGTHRQTFAWIDKNLIDNGQPKKSPGGITTLNGKWFNITIDEKTGRIQSIVDNRTQREIIKNDPDQPLGLMYQRASAEMCDQFMNDYCQNLQLEWVHTQLGKQGVPRDVAELRFFPLEVEEIVTGLCSMGTLYNFQYKSDPNLPFGEMVFTIFQFNYRPQIGFWFTATAKKPDLWPEAGYFCFPLNIENPQFRLGRLGGIVDPAKDIVPGSNRHMQWLRTGVAVFGDDGYGVGICPLETPLVSLGEPGCWRFSKDYIPDKANIYFNLFNNQWTTNFYLWNHGDISAGFMLWTFDEYDNESSLITPSLEALAFNHGIWVSEETLKPGTHGVTLSRKGIYVTSFGLDVDTEKLMLRFWEMAGKGGGKGGEGGKDDPAVTVTLPDGLDAKTATPCDLRGRPIAEPIPITAGSFQIDVKPYSPVNLRLE
ncbi:MAG: hypothetical protein FWC43_02030 [Planctomycetaceae bacterium]|nr:hypothetical protein [Planctomycetaceae bacterium]